MNWLFNHLGKIGVKARLPAELMFLDSFYLTQTLSADKIMASSFVDPYPDATIYTTLPSIIQYYLTRWDHLNLIPALQEDFFRPGQERAELFQRSPRKLLHEMHDEHITPLDLND